jgi:hypothetical protein
MWIVLSEERTLMQFKAFIIRNTCHLYLQFYIVTWRFPFRRLLPLLGLRWRSSNLSPHGCGVLSKSKLPYDWRSVSRYVLVSRTLVGLETRYYFLSVCCCLKFAVLFLWGAPSDERMRLQFAVQSLNAPRCAEPLTILYCLIWDPSNLEDQVPLFISPRTRVASYTPGHWVPFTLLLATRRATVEVF